MMRVSFGLFVLAVSASVVDGFAPVRSGAMGRIGDAKSTALFADVPLFDNWKTSVIGSSPGKLEEGEPVSSPVSAGVAVMVSSKAGIHD